VCRLAGSEVFGPPRAPGRHHETGGQHPGVHESGHAHDTSTLVKN